MVLGGVIYLRSIPQDDRIDTVSTNLRHLRALCKPSGLGKVILATTKWDQFIQNSGDKEKILKRVDWEYRRFKPKGNDAEESALDIVNAILKCVNQDDTQNLPIEREPDHPMRAQQQTEKLETTTQDRAQAAEAKKGRFWASLRRRLFG
ncbi:hypothetical protein VKT23_007770 [Stygiomarasmius scandens]|uniref:AIG1-type G domain-containing protein n=1 Tax=Marasmiellus scandens TaxID=2682957 RepID=A0ABR1JJ73_9AGAR